MTTPARLTSVGLTGVDVSKYQGIVPWARVRDECRVSFAFAKCTEGRSPDPLWHENADGIREAGIILGAYHYLRRDLDHSVQMEAFTTTLGGTDGAATTGGAATKLVAIDFEDRFVTDAYMDCLRLSCHALRALDYNVLIYTSPGFWNGMRESARAWAVNYPLWIAHYGVMVPTVPKPWDEWTMWQYDGDGGRRLPNGVDCDWNLCVLPVEELRLLAEPNVPRPLPVPDYVPPAHDRAGVLRAPEPDEPPPRNTSEE